MNSSKINQRSRELISVLKSLSKNWMAGQGIPARVGSVLVPPIPPYYLSILIKEENYFLKKIKNGDITNFFNNIDKGYSLRILTGDDVQGYAEQRIANNQLENTPQKIAKTIGSVLKPCFNYAFEKYFNALGKSAGVVDDFFIRLSYEEIEKHYDNFKKPKFNDFSYTNSLLEWSNELFKLNYIERANADICNTFNNKFFIDSEGRELALQNISDLLGLEIELIHKNNFAITYPDIIELKNITKEDLEKKLYDSFKIVELLRNAGNIETGNYPVVLSHGATATTFHETFTGHLISAKYIMGDVSTIYGNKLNKRILPEFITVIDNPLVKGHGSFLYDDEGIKAKKIIIVKDGILKNFLYDRITAAYFNTHSNGRARMAETLILDKNNNPVFNVPEPRAGNLEILSSKQVPDEQVFEIMKKYCRDNNKPFGVYIETMRGRVRPNSGDFSILPTRAYKIYPDGTKKEITNFFAKADGNILNKIQITGNTYKTIFQKCDATSGSIPIQSTAPICFIPELDIVATKPRKLTKG